MPSLTKAQAAALRDFYAKAKEFGSKSRGVYSDELPGDRRTLEQLVKLEVLKKTEELQGYGDAFPYTTVYWLGMKAPSEGSLARTLRKRRPGRRPNAGKP